MAEPLNQFLISRALGSTMKECRRAGFGHFDLLHSQSRPTLCRPAQDEQIVLAKGADEIIIQAFNETHDGYSVDRTLADPQHAERFLKRCRTRGLRTAEVADINQRLLTIRKKKKYSGTLNRATRKERDTSFQPYLPAAEFALMQMNYRYGGTVDDLLADPERGRVFDDLAERIKPGGGPVSYRLAALYIRKQRHCSTADVRLFDNLSPGKFARRIVNLGNLSKVSPSDIPDGEGVVIVSERADRERDLFIQGDKHLRSATAQLTDLGIYRTVANHFWQPDPLKIFVGVLEVDKKYLGLNRRMWELKLIRERQPVFNYPVEC